MGEDHDSLKTSQDYYKIIEIDGKLPFFTYRFQTPSLLVELTDQKSPLQMMTLTLTQLFFSSRLVKSWSLTPEKGFTTNGPEQIIASSEVILNGGFSQGSPPQNARKIQVKDL